MESPAPDLAHISIGEAEDILAVEPYFSRRVTGGGIAEQAQDRKRGHGFAGTGLADERDCLARADPERHVLDRVRDAVARLEINGEIPHIEKRLPGGLGAGRRGDLGQLNHQGHLAR